MLVRLGVVRPRERIRAAAEHLAPLGLEGALLRAALLDERDLGLRGVALLVELVRARVVRPRERIRVDHLAPLGLEAALARAVLEEDLGLRGVTLLVELVRLGVVRPRERI